MEWYLWSAVPLAFFLWRAWHAGYPRSRAGWFALAHGTLALYAAVVFADVAAGTRFPLLLLFLPMLVMAFVSGALAGIYTIRWRMTPPGPPRVLMGVRCSHCQEDIPADPPGEFPANELIHHLRLFHPDSYEELMERMPPGEES